MIRTIAKKEFRSLVSAPSTWWLLALMQFLFTLIYLYYLDHYLQLQAQLAQLDNALGATISIATPFCLWLELILMILIPFFTMRLIAEERRNQTWVLLVTAPISATHIVLGKFLGLMLLIVFIVAGCAAMLSTLMFGTRADIGLLLSDILGILLFATSYAALGLYFSALSKHTFIAAISALGMSLGLGLLYLFASNNVLRSISPNTHLENLFSGLVSSADLIYFVLFISTLLWLTIRHLNNERLRAS